MFQDHVVALLADPESSVRRALLGSITSLCVFFGRQRSNDFLLSHLITYLNDRDWMLRCAFFESIVGIATFVGGSSMEEYILPLLTQAITGMSSVGVANFRYRGVRNRESPECPCQSHRTRPFFKSQRS